MKDVFSQEDTLHWEDCSFRPLVTSRETGGTLSMTDTLVAPGFDPGRHYHEDADEYFLILDGEIEVELEGVRSLKSPGEAVFIPRGKVHSFRNPGNSPARKIVIFTPGGFEAWFAEMAQFQYHVPADMAAIIEAAKRHHMVVVGPPMGPA